MDNSAELKAETRVDEVNVKCSRKTAAIYLKYYLTASERKELIHDHGDAACLLFEYYLRMASIGDEQITDTTAADYFGWSIQKVQRNRLALMKSGWYSQARYNMPNKRKGITYYIGKDAVRQAHQ